MNGLRVLGVCLSLWLPMDDCRGAAPSVAAPSAEERERLQLDPFYEKLASAQGFPIVSSAKVADAALLEAVWIIDQMLEHRPDVRAELIRHKTRLCIMATSEFTTDLPDFADLQPKFYWDRRARGLGGDVSLSCGEENLLCYPGDPYAAENILIHEFAHTIDAALRRLDPAFGERLETAFREARAAGLWKGAYAGTNPAEYWAEGVQCWFDNNRENDREHNHVNTRQELKVYDPALAELVLGMFGETPWKYSRPETRTDLPHLASWNAAEAPRFEWPARLLETNRKFFDELPGTDPPASPPAAEWTELSALPAESIAAQKSTTGGPPVTVFLINRTDEELKIAWIDFEGHPKVYDRLRPGFPSQQSTFAGHVWLATTLDDQPVAAFVAGKQLGRAVITATPAAKSTTDQPAPR